MHSAFNRGFLNSRLPSTSYRCHKPIREADACNDTNLPPIRRASGYSSCLIGPTAKCHPFVRRISSDNRDENALIIYRSEIAVFDQQAFFTGTPSPGRLLLVQDLQSLRGQQVGSTSLSKVRTALCITNGRQIPARRGPAGRILEVS
jgi:hypothetical protein